MPAPRILVIHLMPIVAHTPTPSILQTTSRRAPYRHFTQHMLDHWRNIAAAHAGAIRRHHYLSIAVVSRARTLSSRRAAHLRQACHVIATRHCLSRTIINNNCLSTPRLCRDADTHIRCRAHKDVMPRYERYAKAQSERELLMPPGSARAAAVCVTAPHIRDAMFI